MKKTSEKKIQRYLIDDTHCEKIRRRTVMNGEKLFGRASKKVKRKKKMRRELIIIVETFHSRVIAGTNAEINIIVETQTIGIGDATMMISNGRCIFREEEYSSMFTSLG